VASVARCSRAQVARHGIIDRRADEANERKCAKRKQDRDVPAPVLYKASGKFCPALQDAFRINRVTERPEQPEYSRKAAPFLKIRGMLQPGGSPLTA
jgi:hypothetical protein